MDHYLSSSFRRRATLPFLIAFLPYTDVKESSDSSGSLPDPTTVSSELVVSSSESELALCLPLPDEVGEEEWLDAQLDLVLSVSLELVGLGGCTPLAAVRLDLEINNAYPVIPVFEVCTVSKRKRKAKIHKIVYVWWVVYERSFRIIPSLGRLPPAGDGGGEGRARAGRAAGAGASHRRRHERGRTRAERPRPYGGLSPKIPDFFSNLQIPSGSEVTRRPRRSYYHYFKRKNLINIPRFRTDFRRGPAECPAGARRGALVTYDFAKRPRLNEHVSLPAL
ncbi:hypothetical protein EVAR_28927_1 [Eumeta japonica]|uniref:Uncharacterized protein n=1 Tax=Eumeta variegata TaxID=151549 RepID=A0A4C1YNS4_EUMVA|nr:hypothetical protein EVAR_28927_1 [Eumeta japonica]